MKGEEESILAVLREETNKIIRKLMAITRSEDGGSRCVSTPRIYVYHI